MGGRERGRVRGWEEGIKERRKGGMLYEVAVGNNDI